MNGYPHAMPPFGRGLPPPGYPPIGRGLPPPGYPPNGFPGMPLPPMPFPPRTPVFRPQDFDHMHEKLIAAGLINKITNVWVGKISPVVEDETVKKLLEACGIVVTWDRLEKDGQLKSFGFCKFASPEGALRSLRLLDGVRLGDDNLQLKVDQKTTEELAEYEKRKKVFIEQEEAEQKKTGSQFPIPFSDSGEQDSRAKEIIDKITESIQQALETGEGTGIVSREIRNYREKQARADRERKEREEEAERKRKRLEEEEEKKARRLKERAEREYKDKEYDWIDHEKTRERDKKRAEQESTEKQIKRKQALLLDDEDDKSRRRAIRQTRKQRGYERDDDRHDRAREIHEQEQSRKQREREEQRVREEAQRKADRSSQVHLEPDQDRMQLDNEHTSQGTRIKSPIGQGQFKEQVQVVAQPEKPTSGFSVSLVMAPNKRAAPSAQLFKVEAEEEQEQSSLHVPNKKRKLVTLDDTEPADSKQKQEHPPTQPLTDAQTEARAKAQAVIDRIPTTQAELFQETIDWELIDKMDIVEQKMRPWIKKKIVDFLGEEEQTLIDYICKKLTEHTPPQEILNLLGYVLEDEAPDFVIRMWRMLIYNILMAQL